jgi:hypothetical protein
VFRTVVADSILSARRLFISPNGLSSLSYLFLDME